jgi:hypothetical protein
VVRENLQTLLAAAEQGFAGAPLPDFVRAGNLRGRLPTTPGCGGIGPHPDAAGRPDLR